MTYQDLYEKAIRLLDDSEITIGEYDEMIKPLKHEICEWIPVSERLPNVGEDVLFCDRNWTEEGCLRADDDWWQYRCSTVMPKEKVIAWMPLPEPYREDGEV